MDQDDKVIQYLQNKKGKSNRKFRKELSEFQQVDELQMPDCPICEEPLEVCSCQATEENLHHKWLKESLDEEIPF